MPRRATLINTYGQVALPGNDLRHLGTEEQPASPRLAPWPMVSSIPASAMRK